MITNGFRNTFFSRCMAIFTLAGLSALSVSCKKQPQEAVVMESASLNGGFRIVPALAARDQLRPRVIYRCNVVTCGEKFQPSNEDADILLPCDLDRLKFPAGVLPPYYRTVAVKGVQQLIINVQHQQSCQEPKPFPQVVADKSAGVAQAGTEPLRGCRQFNASPDVCGTQAAEGCRWVTHPSGRDSLGRGGDCVGLSDASASVSGMENSQVLQIDKTPVQWAPLESYRQTP